MGNPRTSGSWRGWGRSPNVTPLPRDLFLQGEIQQPVAAGDLRRGEGINALAAQAQHGNAVQIRFSEAFTLLPILMPEAVPALLVGCLLSNILGGCTIFDIVFGSLATLLAAVCTRRLRDKFWLAALMPVLFNGVIVGAVVHFCYSTAIALPLCMLSVAAGEAVACLVVGPLLISVLRRMPASVLN